MAQDAQRHAGLSTRCYRAANSIDCPLKRSPDTATAEDIRLFQLHLAETGMSICNRNRIMTGVRFLFRVTLRRLDLAAEIYHLREPQKIAQVMSSDETRRLLAVAASLKARVALSLSYGGGLRASEVVPVEGQAYRQGAKDYSHRAVQGPQGSERNAVTQDARSVATVVEGAPNTLGHGRAAGGALVVPRP